MTSTPERPWYFDWDALSRDYARDHTKFGTKLTHQIGIPMIMLAVIGATQYPPGSPLPLVALVLPLYFLWELRLGVMMSVTLFSMGRLALSLPGWSLWALFVLGWTLQLVGHRFYEKRNPAFLKNLIHLFVGPAWILEQWRKKLKAN